MKVFCTLLLLFNAVSSLAVEPDPNAALATVRADSGYLLTAEMWARPRSGTAVAEMLPIRNAVRQLLATPAGRLLIRYPGGDDGSIWAQELQAWLVSLGVGPALISMRPGSGQPDQIELQVIVEASRVE